MLTKDTTSTVRTVLLILAIVLFLLSAAGVDGPKPTSTSPRFNLSALGLALCTLAALIP